MEDMNNVININDHLKREPEETNTNAILNFLKQRDAEQSLSELPSAKERRHAFLHAYYYLYEELQQAERLGQQFTTTLSRSYQGLMRQPFSKALASEDRSRLNRVKDAIVDMKLCMDKLQRCWEEEELRRREYDAETRSEDPREHR